MFPSSGHASGFFGNPGAKRLVSGDVCLAEEPRPDRDGVGAGASPVWEWWVGMKNGAGPKGRAPSFGGQGSPASFVADAIFGGVIVHAFGIVVDGRVEIFGGVDAGKAADRVVAAGRQLFALLLS